MPKEKITSLPGMVGLSRCRVNPEVPLFVLVGLLLLILKPTATSAGVVGHKHEIKGYHVGQNVTFECKREGRWVPGPYALPLSLCLTHLAAARPPTSFFFLLYEVRAQKRATR